MPSPTVLVSLTPDGSLALHLPGADGLGDRVIPLRQTGTINPAETIRQVLMAQSRGELGIGRDGEPTRQQLAHMERHQQFADDRCPFCRSAAIAKAMEASSEALPHQSSHRFDARYAWQSRGEVAVRRIPLGDDSRKAASRQRGKAATAERQAARAAAMARLTESAKDLSKDLGF
jgi:hypothetical protein